MMSTQTLDELKQTAKRRQEERDAAELNLLNSEFAAHAARQTSLLDFIRSTSPFSALGSNARMTTADDYGRDDYKGAVVVAFAIPDHAEIAARFKFEERHNQETNEREARWWHVGFQTRKGVEYSYLSDDDKKMWRVRAFDRIEWDGEGDVYVPIYITSDFEDVGDALLYAERAFVDPLQIDDQVAEANATKAFTSPVATEPPAPEPTTEEIFMSALKDLILEFASQTRGEFA